MSWPFRLPSIMEKEGLEGLQPADNTAYLGIDQAGVLAECLLTPSEGLATALIAEGGQSRLSAGEPIAQDNPKSLRLGNCDSLGSQPERVCPYLRRSTQCERAIFWN